MSDTIQKKHTFFEALIEALGDSEDQAVEEVIEELKEEGVDLEKEQSKFIELFRGYAKTAKRCKLDIAKLKRTQTEELRQGIIGKFSDWSLEQIINRIDNISRITGGELCVSHRDLQGKTIEDIRRILEDLELTLLRIERDDSSGIE